jgi:hypothetical protein
VQQIPSHTASYPAIRVVHTETDRTDG